MHEGKYSRRRKKVDQRFQHNLLLGADRAPVNRQGKSRYSPGHWPGPAPGLAAVATLAFVNSWNEFLIAYVLINDDSQKVLSIGLASYVDQFTTDYSGLFAMATLTTLPVVIVFMVFQRYLVGGLTTGSVKG